MIKENEYIRFLNITPKLFLNDYSYYISSVNELLKTGTLIKNKIGTDRFYQFPLSEQFFCYLKNGLEVSQDTYDARYKQIAKSKEYHKFLETPLLLIFTNSKFVSATKKTPELYFEVYKEIIANNKKALFQYTSIAARGMSGKVFAKKVEDLMIDHNFGANDLIYLSLNSKLFDLVVAINQLLSCHNPLTDGLVWSDLNSHIINELLKLQNEISFDIIDKIIVTKKHCELDYLQNFKFENGVSALAWFKAFLVFNKNESPEEYTKNFKNYVNLKLEFLTCDIYSPKIKSMFPNLENSVIPSEIPSQVSAVSLEREQINQTKLPFTSFDSYTDFFQSTNSTLTSDQTFLKRKLLDSAINCASSEISVSDDQYKTTSSAYLDSTESKKHKNEDETVQEIDFDQEIEFTVNSFLNPSFF